MKLTPNKEQIDAARRILNSRQDQMEEPIRRNIITLLEKFDIECNAPYPTDDGPADIYCPRYRLFIETKASGNAGNPNQPQAGYDNESPREQLERYLFSEIKRVKGMLDLDAIGDRRWVGILTDGHVWHAWIYDHHTASVAREEFRDLRPKTPEDLIQTIYSLISDGPIGKPWIPANPRSVFESDLQELHDCYHNLSSHLRDNLETKISLWLEMLRTASMEPENDAAKHRLFVRHTFLVGLARGVVHTLSSPREEPDFRKILGDGFVSWIIDTQQGREWGAAFLKRIHSYEWRQRRGDVLRALYEQLIDERDRKVFGEYYTPDWMAEWLVEEVLDDEWCRESVDAALAAGPGQEGPHGIGVLDPTCGSGTFLYHAARKLLKTPNISDLPKSQKASVVARLVNGIDVHPVAAEISRATLLRALPEQPIDEVSALRIYEGDALLLLQDDEQSLFYPKNGEVRILTPKGTEITLPKSFVDNARFTELLRRMVLSATKNENLPIDIQNSVPDRDRNLMLECHHKFVEVISMEGNSVWTWFISNTAGPYRLAQQKVNRIIANPPWVRMADIQSEFRKRSLEQFAEHSLGIWSGGKVAPHFDIAQMFVKRVRQLYLMDQKENPGAWIVKKSAIKASNWQRFRKWHESFLAQIVDMEKIQVFGSGDARRCCVLFECRRVSKLFSLNSPQVIARYKSKRPTTEMGLDDASKLLTFDVSAHKLTKEKSDYVIDKNPVFRQGATIVPQVLLEVDKILNPVAKSKNVKIVTTRSEKGKWETIEPLVGDIPSHWLRILLKSRNLLPFKITSDLPRAIIPTDLKGNLMPDPASVNSFWKELESIYREYSGKGRNTPKTLISQIDYAGKLSSQLLQSPRRLKTEDRRVVLYPASSDIMRASRYDANSSSIVGSKLYRWTADSTEEAAYLVGILNAPSLSEAFKELRTSGRDFHLSPWRNIPIRKFSANNSVHRKISNVCVQAEHHLDELFESDHLDSLGQVAASKRIRQKLDEMGIFVELDKLVQKILPEYVNN